MKKIILPLVIIVLLLTGCSVVRLNSLSLDEVIDYSFDNIYKTNKSFKGYKIYLPNDMTMINDEKEKNVEIKFDDDKIAWYQFNDLDQIEHSYSITIHKAQRKRI